ncbi:hypothetical protein DL93DRAFT_2085020 [Clavulina sp. PMI_390]|nr:hypothetical protein DL93DRAFT_2085020 [Clavulina sp. PMI_390]
MAGVKSKLFGGGPKGVSIPDPPTAPAGSAENTPPPVVVTKIDFEAYNLPEYAHRNALVIDNLFTPEDCARLLAAAEASNEWAVAQLNGGGALQYTDTSYRNSGRILYDDHELADWILDKMRPYLKDTGVEFIADANRHAMLRAPGHDKANRGARLTRLNERLRFLRYGPGEFFKPHVDGSYYTPDRKQVSYYTFQIYLNGDAKSLKGGATRFWPKFYHGRRSRTQNGQQREINYIDVESRTGRVLIFEHEGLMHSGEEVTKGVKYSVRTDFMYEEVPAEEEQVQPPAATENQMDIDEPTNQA